MSSNARRRRLKIVEPLVPNREQELVGGLKNALNRGDDLIKAKQSFISAGYNQAEVDSAAQKVQSGTPQIGRQITTTSETKPLPGTTNSKSSSKILKIILIIIAVLILGAAAVAGIFWDKIIRIL